MVTTRYKPLVDRLLNPVGMALARAGVSPSAVTLTGVALTAAACTWLITARAVVPFCLVMAVVEGLDAVDGAVARVSGRVTAFGAYLDALCDRYVDGMVAIAVGIVTGYWVLIAIVLLGSFLVSYAKARAAMEVAVSNREWPDLMERAERSAVFLLGLMAGELVPWQPGGRDLFWWTLVVLTVLIHVTVLQRVWRARAIIGARRGSA